MCSCQQANPFSLCTHDMLPFCSMIAAVVLEARAWCIALTGGSSADTELVRRALRVLQGNLSAGKFHCFCFPCQCYYSTVPLLIVYMLVNFCALQCLPVRVWVHWSGVPQLMPWYGCSQHRLKMDAQWHLHQHNCSRLLPKVLTTCCSEPIEACCSVNNDIWRACTQGGWVCRPSSRHSLQTLGQNPLPHGCRPPCSGA